MSTKRRTTEQAPQQAAPASTTPAPVETQAAPVQETEKEQEQKAPVAEQAPQQEAWEHPLIKRMQKALLTYPTLEAGYLCKAGAFFDKEVAEKQLEEGEELIIVERPERK